MSCARLRFLAHVQGHSHGQFKGPLGDLLHTVTFLSKKVRLEISCELSAFT